jgi:hypothetical protein
MERLLRGLDAALPRWADFMQFASQMLLVPYPAVPEAYPTKSFLFLVFLGRSRCYIGMVDTGA